MIASISDPGNVINDITRSKKFAVSGPGLIPGMKPPLRFKSSAILLVGTLIAVEKYEKIIISNAETKLYSKPNILPNVVAMPWALSDEDNPAKTGGINIIGCAKMIGITPEAFSFKGIH